jgi:hypothetical protein
VICGRAIRSHNLLRNIFLPDCNTPRIHCRSVSSKNLLRVILGDGTAMWLRPNRPKESILGKPEIGPIGQIQMQRKWDYD